jgi:hypothetical protein
MKMMAVKAVVAGAAVYAAPALSSATPTDTDLNPNQVRYAYVEPTNPAHRPIYERFKTVLSGNREEMAKLSMHDLEEILAATLSGMSVEEFDAEVTI